MLNAGCDMWAEGLYRQMAALAGFRFTMHMRVVLNLLQTRAKRKGIFEQQAASIIRNNPHIVYAYNDHYDNVIQQEWNAGGVSV